MRDFQIRVVREQSLLVDKISALSDFIESSHPHASLSDDERNRLSRQLYHMSQYRQVLDERIAAF